jgi:hypothetical protein
LAAPAFVGLSRFAGSRGRVAFAGREFAVGELLITEDGPSTAPQDAILIAVSREGDFAIAHEFSHLAPGDRALVVLSLERFREGKDTLAAAAQRFLRDGYSRASREDPAGWDPPGRRPGLRLRGKFFRPDGVQSLCSIGFPRGQKKRERQQRRDQEEIGKDRHWGSGTVGRPPCPQSAGFWLHNR